MDPEAPKTVAIGVATTSFTGALLAGLYGSLRAQTPGVSPGLYAASTALNCGIASATFFTIREYLVSPLLLVSIEGGQFGRRRRELEHRNNGPVLVQSEDTTWRDIRQYKLVDSSLSGGVTGAVLNSWKRGVRGIPRGATTGALTCALLQFCTNEVEIYRQKYLSRRSIDSSASPRLSHSGATHDSNISTNSPPEPAKPLSERIFDRLGLFKKISDDDYLRMMKAKRDSYLAQIRNLEEHIAREKEQKERENEEKNANH